MQAVRSIWKGAISFGLVTIPVRLLSALDPHGLSFNQLHRPCHARIRYVKRCSHCGKEVEPREIVRGYQYATDRYVVVTDDDLQSLPLPTLRQIRIIDFVNLDEVDPVYYKSVYYLAPDELGARAFGLLASSLDRSSRGGVAQVSFRQREHLALVRPKSGTLVLHTLHYTGEIRALPDTGPLDAAVPAGREAALADQLIDSMTSGFDPARYRDEYRDALNELITARIEGREVVTAPETDEEPVMDLARALEESLAAVRG